MPIFTNVTYIKIFVVVTYIMSYSAGDPAHDRPPRGDGHPLSGGELLSALASHAAFSSRSPGGGPPSGMQSTHSANPLSTAWGGGLSPISTPRAH